MTRPADAPMRIASAHHDDARWELTLDAAARPGDQLVRRRGVQVLVDRGAVAMLDDKVLDAWVQGGSVQFSVQRRHRPGAAEQPAPITGAGDLAER